MPQNEIIYAELWNMAQKTRENGGYERMRDVLLASFAARSGVQITKAHFKATFFVRNEDDQDEQKTKSNDKEAMLADPSLWEDQNGYPIPSNLPGKISATFALIGTPGWEDKYNDYLSKAIEIAQSESTMTTWRKSFVKDAMSTGEHLDRGEEVKRQLKSARLITPSMEAEMEALNSLKEGGLAELLKAISEN